MASVQPAKSEGTVVFCKTGRFFVERRENYFFEYFLISFYCLFDVFLVFFNIFQCFKKFFNVFTMFLCVYNDSSTNEIFSRKKENTMLVSSNTFKIIFLMVWYLMYVSRSSKDAAITTFPHC